VVEQTEELWCHWLQRQDILFFLQIYQTGLEAHWSSYSCRAGGALFRLCVAWCLIKRMDNLIMTSFKYILWETVSLPFKVLQSWLIWKKTWMNKLFSKWQKCLFISFSSLFITSWSLLSFIVCFVITSNMLYAASVCCFYVISVVAVVVVVVAVVVVICSLWWFIWHWKIVKKNLFGLYFLTVQNIFWEVLNFLNMCWMCPILSLQNQYYCH
jgi:hypothetical protein